jgi:hypothetical protein
MSNYQSCLSGETGEIEAGTVEEQVPRILLTPEQRVEAARRSSAKYRMKSHQKEMVRQAKTRAIKRGVPFDLQPSDIVIPDKCPVLNIPLVRGIGTYSDNSPSLDCIEPSLGYVPGNVSVVSWRANRIKSNGLLNELIDICLYIAKHRVETPVGNF